jgi:hypothetical protein
VTIAYHEQMLLVIYRTLTDDGRAAVDRALSYEWCGRRHQTQAPQSPKEINAGNTRFEDAARDLLAEHTPGDALAYFANCWQKDEVRS